jgi:hypothetical protein
MTHFTPTFTTPIEPLPASDLAALAALDGVPAPLSEIQNTCYLFGVTAFLSGTSATVDENGDCPELAEPVPSPLGLSFFGTVGDVVRYKTSL